MSAMTPAPNGMGGARESNSRLLRVSPGLTVAVIAALLAALGAVFVDWIQTVHVEDAAGRSALETAVGLSALAAVTVMSAHVRRSRRRRDLLLLVAISAAALTDIVFDALPAYRIQTDIRAAGVLVALGLIRAGSLLAAALTSPGRAQSDGRSLRRAILPVAFLSIALGEGAELLLVPNVGQLGAFEPVFVVAGLLAFSMLVFAAVEFARRSGQADSEAELLAAAALLLAASQLSRLAVPFSAPGWLMPADALRAGFFILMLTIAIRLYRRDEEQFALAAVAEERLRIAHDLHDGLAQDLALIAAYAQRLAETYGADHPVAIAASRALAASRGRIVELEAAGSQTVEGAMRELAAELGRRFGVRVEVDATAVDRADELDAQERRELVRIAREAIANAVRHGGARTITVKLGSRRSGALLSLSDDGCGLSRARAESAGTGLGLRAMSHRARRLGARLQVGESPLGGAEVDVIPVEGADRATARD